MLRFALASLVLIALPGPDYLLITTNAMVHGRGAGWKTTLGGASGVIVHAAGAVLGISAVLATSVAAFTVVKVLGVASLLYLGIGILVARKHANEETSRNDMGPPARPFLQGFVSNALNPKVALFFLTFLPQFMSANGNSLFEALELSSVFAVLYVAWFGALVLVVGFVTEMLRRPAVTVWMARVSGAALITFGVRLAVSPIH